MEKRFISLEQTGLFPRLIRDYTSGREDMSPFYDFSPDISGLKEKMEQVHSLKRNDSLLADVLEEQHGTALSESQRKNLLALKENRAFTICTGHQLCLFSGPVYMIYKIVSVIKLSKILSEASGEPIVPVFWMASEDHDVEEVDHTYLFGKKLSLGHHYEGPVGRMELTDIRSSLDDLFEILGDSDHAADLKKLMEDAYGKADSMAQAFRVLVQSIFSSYGLLILDADRAELKREFVEEMVDEVLGQRTFKDIEKTLTQLKSRGETVQAHAREINIFYMTDGLRARVIQEGENFIAKGTGIKWTASELEKAIRVNPQEFSPNVLLRPLYQEKILPNLAYVGGPGELSYWLQLKSVFEGRSMKMPALFLRDSFFWLDKKTEAKWNALGMELNDLFRPIDTLQKEYALKNSDSDPSLKGEKEVMVSHFDSLIERSRQIDPGIVGFANAERQRLIKSIENLEKKLVRSEKKKHDDALGRMSQIQGKLLPNGGLRERKENFMHWYLSQGDEFFTRLIAQSDPLEPGLKVLSV